MAMSSEIKKLKREKQQLEDEVHKLNKQLEESRDRKMEGLNRKVVSWRTFQTALTKESTVSAGCEDSSDEETSSDDDDVSSNYSEPPVPTEVSEKVKELCEHNDVQNYLILQDPKNQLKFEIFGFGASSILQSTLDEVNKSWEYTIATLDRREGGYAITKQCVWDHPVLNKYSMVNRKWISEFIVQARDSNNQMVKYAVGPAHMLFDCDLNQYLQQQYSIDEFRDNLHILPPGERYAIQFVGVEDEGERITNMLHFQQIPFFGYRYRCEQENPPVDSPVHPRRFLNDIALFRLDDNVALAAAERLRHWRPNVGEVVEITELGQLNGYVRAAKKIRVVVKEFKGWLYPNRLSVDQHQMDGQAYSLLFRLDTDVKKLGNINRDATQANNADEMNIQLALQPGDSGSIVYRRIRGEEDSYHPLGMFIGYADWEQYRYPPGVYQAVFLRQALDDLQFDYPDQIQSRIIPL